MSAQKRIASFEVDHTKLLPGIYVSRIDGDITTYDLRMKRPNAGNYIDPVAAHSVEHMVATYIRSSGIGNDVIYFGPMGCRTGFYLLVRNADNQKVLQELKETLIKVIDHDGPMFGASAAECGNYRELDLLSAKNECLKYLIVLNEIGDTTFEYRK